MEARQLEQLKDYCDSVFKSAGVNDETIELVTRVGSNMVKMHMEEFCEHEQRMRFFKETGMLPYNATTRRYPLTKKECYWPHDINPYETYMGKDERKSGILHFDIKR